MDSSVQVIEAIKDHEKRISALESLVSGSKSRLIPQRAESLTARILELREQGFLSQPKTAEEVWVKINASYPCESNRVSVALLRLAEKKQLRKVTKTIGQKELKAYAR